MVLVLLVFMVIVKYSIFLLFFISYLIGVGFWLYLGNGVELYLWEYGDGNVEYYFLFCWVLGLLGIIVNLEVN